MYTYCCSSPGVTQPSISLPLYNARHRAAIARLSSCTYSGDLNNLCMLLRHLLSHNLSWWHSEVQSNSFNFIFILSWFRCQWSRQIVMQHYCDRQCYYQRYSTKCSMDMLQCRYREYLKALHTVEKAALLCLNTQHSPLPQQLCCLLSSSSVLKGLSKLFHPLFRVEIGQSLLAQYS